MEANTAAMLKQLDVTYDVPDIEIEAAIRKYREKRQRWSSTSTRLRR